MNDLSEIVRNNIDEFTKTLNKLIGKKFMYTTLDDVTTFYFDNKQFNIAELNNKLYPYLNRDIGLGITTTEDEIEIADKDELKSFDIYTPMVANRKVKFALFQGQTLKSINCHESGTKYVQMVGMHSITYVLGFDFANKKTKSGSIILNYQIPLSKPTKYRKPKP